jgi:hypothetical protein
MQKLQNEQNDMFIDSNTILSILLSLKLKSLRNINLSTVHSQDQGRIKANYALSTGQP